MRRTRGTMPGPPEHSDRLFEQWFLNTLCCLPEGSPARSVCSIQLCVIMCVPTVLDIVSKGKRGERKKRRRGANQSTKRTRRQGHYRLHVSKNRGKRRTYRGKRDQSFIFSSNLCSSPDNRNCFRRSTVRRTQNFIISPQKKVGSELTFSS
jgi:hypothetical protein